MGRETAPPTFGRGARNPGVFGQLGSIPHHQLALVQARSTGRVWGRAIATLVATPARGDGGCASVVLITRARTP